MRDGFKVIDGHVHTFSSDEVSEKIIESFNKIYDIQFSLHGTGTIGDVLGNMDKAGIDITIMANFAPPKILHANNLWGIKTSSQNQGLAALVSFHPEMEGNLRHYLESYIEAGAKGIKFHPMAQDFEPDSHKLQDVYKCCSEIGFPVVFHCGRVSNARLNEYSDVSMILPVIEKYPEIPIVLTHMADGNVEDVKELAEHYSNVYFDTSIVITGFEFMFSINEPSWQDDEMVVDVINKIGAHRVIFGSDYP